LLQPREVVADAIDKIGLEEKVRPHDLTLAQWEALTFALENITQ